MDSKQQYLEDLERGKKDREKDIKEYGEKFVNHYKFKDENGVRYNIIGIDKMFEQLKTQAQKRGL